MKERACSWCGLIQWDDPVFGLVYCDAPEIEIDGCFPKEFVEKNYPDLKYDESVTRKERGFDHWPKFPNPE